MGAKTRDLAEALLKSSLYISVFYLGGGRVVQFTLTLAAPSWGSRESLSASEGAKGSWTLADKNWTHLQRKWPPV